MAHPAIAIATTDDRLSNSTAQEVGNVKVAPTEKMLKFIRSSVKAKLVTHKLQTEDGYILSLFRYTGERKKNDNNCSAKVVDPVLIERGKVEQDCHIPAKKPVLLITGLANSGVEWLAHEEDKMLPAILSNEGYDCWMGCVRGSIHSLEHATFTKKNKKFWDFSLDELAKYDIPAFIDYILKATSQEDLYYVGHSMGGAVIMATLSQRLEYSRRIRVAVGLSPGVYGHHYGTKTNKVLIPVLAGLGRLKTIYRRPFGSKTTFDVFNKIIPNFTSIDKRRVAGHAIELGSKLVGGVVPGCDIDKEMYKRMAELIPSSTSLKNGCHSAQLFSSNKFQAYNYGRRENLRRYGQRDPPLYDLSKISVPILLFSSTHDLLVPAKDVAKTAEELPNVIGHTVLSSSSPKFSHCDFLFGTNVVEKVYLPMVQVFNEYLTKEHVKS